MPSHELPLPVDPRRRAGLLTGLALLMSGLAGAATPVGAQAAAVPPPDGAVAVDWDHFGEPSLSAARRAHVAVSRAMKAPAVDTALYRLPGDVGWERVLAHYRGAAARAWKPLAGAARVEAGNPAWQQRFVAADDDRRGFAVVWLPAAGEVRDGLLMVLTPTR